MNVSSAMTGYLDLDPLHWSSSAEASWTTGNVAEAIPGVQTPLSFSFWSVPFERTVRGSYSEMGVLPRSEGRRLPARAEDAALGIFHGRPALNVNVILEVGAGLPGASAAEVARTVLGTEEVASLPPNRPRRYPVVAVKLPFLATRLRRRMSRLGSEVCETWEAARREPMSAERARELLPVARRQFTLSLLNHSHATFLSQAAYEQLEKLVSAAGRADSMSQLLSGLGGMLEVTMLQRLWLVAHSREDLDDFLGTYGFLGPGAGNLASHPWREEPGPLQRACETYRAVPEEQAPTAIEVRRRTVRERAEAELLGALPRHRRPGARVLLRLARHFIPLREVGKSMYLQAGDSARIAFRALGADLAERELIANPEDVFFLTYDELVGELPSDPGEAIERRRTRYRDLLEGSIPSLFTGTPELNGRPPARDAASALAGIGASGGVVEGTARVVSDPGAETEPLAAGEILVAAATDPSWTTLFLGASAVVIDVGGTLGHGAIVARELGIPCVTNAGNATGSIRSGDRIRVDGDSGSVTIL